MQTTGTENKDIRDLIFGFDDRFEKIVEEVGLATSDKCKVLDIGCGEGKIWQLLPNLDVTGLDILPKNLDKAKKYLKPVKGRAENLPFQDNVFDLVVASEILEHLFLPEKALREIKRVLKPGGKAIITFPNTGSLQIRLGLMIWGQNPTINYPTNKLHLRFFALDDFKKMLENTDLQIQKIRGSSFLSFNKENFGHYIPIPRKIRTIGGDWIPSLALGSLVVVKKKNLLAVWNSDLYISTARRGYLDFNKNLGFLKLKSYTQKVLRVLDCGCADGSTIEKIWHKKTHFYGVDLSEKAIKKGLQRLKSKQNIHLRVGSIEKIDFPDEYFDLSYCAYTLEHLEDPEKVIAQMIRVTKKNGYLIFIGPNYGSPLFPSPCSLFGGKKLTFRAIKNFAKSFVYLIKQPQDLDWLKVKPFCLKAGQWQPDWDTVTEPNIQTLLTFLKKRNLKIIESYSTSRAVCGEFKEKMTKKPNIRQKILTSFKKIALFLEEISIPPFKYYGPNLFVVAQKL